MSLLRPVSLAQETAGATEVMESTPVVRIQKTFAEVVQDLEDLAHNTLDPDNGLSDGEVAESLQIITDLSGIPYEVIVENWRQMLAKVKADEQNDHSMFHYLQRCLKSYGSFLQGTSRKMEYAIYNMKYITWCIWYR